MEGAGSTVDPELKWLPAASMVQSQLLTLELPLKNSVHTIIT